MIAEGVGATDALCVQFSIQTAPRRQNNKIKRYKALLAETRLQPVIMKHSPHAGSVHHTAYILSIGWLVVKSVCTKIQNFPTRKIFL